MCGSPASGRALVQGRQAIDPDGEPSNISLSLGLPAPRAPYFDQLVLDAIAAGTRQVVNLGAGYDDRALRFRHSGVQFFDLDLPEIIADKARRLEALDTDITRVTLAAVNFATDDVADVLAPALGTTPSSPPSSSASTSSCSFSRATWNDCWRVSPATPRRAAFWPSPPRCTPPASTRRSSSRRWTT
ncbi:class I SAM-dependent methyltransferase [Streptomyces mirabilis]|uniref:class I SAM-dependent methyltransferase n=1 Tax=Streptomyces mirabilis TaxID=68239 RepID=UPI0037F864F5